MEKYEYHIKNLALRISYDGLDKVLWREVVVDTGVPLNQLAYLILSAFDTKAQHMYVIMSAGEEYSEGPWEKEHMFDARNTTLADLYLMKGDTLALEYDMGIGHLFNIKVVGENVIMPEGTLPVITAGGGCGIIEEKSVLDLIYYIEQIDLIGKTVEPIYYKDRSEPWDYRKFDLAELNANLSEEMKSIAEAY